MIKYNNNVRFYPARDCLQGFDNTVFVYTFRFIRHCLPDFIDNALEKNNY